MTDGWLGTLLCGPFQRKIATTASGKSDNAGEHFSLQGLKPLNRWELELDFCVCFVFVCVGNAMKVMVTGPLRMVSTD